MVSPFLLRDILDEAIPEKDRDLLLMLVGGMIAISVATGVLGVAQTWLSNLVGQRVMHDLRAQVYRHLQRLSLAFFTRTRTGEIQSRIANDIGGVQTVVTTTATSIVSNVTTVVASVVAMFLLDWRLARVLAGGAAVLRLPVAARGRQAQGDHRDEAGRDGRHLLAGAGVAERVGHPARQVDGPLGRAGRPLRGRVGAARRPRGPLADGRALDDGLDPDLVRGHAGAGLPVRGAVAERGLDRHRGRVHHAADAAVLADLVAAQRGGRRPDLDRAVRPRVRVPRPAGGHPSGDA